MSYIVMRGQWCNIVLNVHVPREDDDSNNNFYEELQQVFEHFFQYNMKILSGGCKIEEQGYFQTDIWE